MFPVEMKQINVKYEGVCLGVVVSEEDCVTLWDPTCAEVSRKWPFWAHSAVGSPPCGLDPILQC